MLRIATSLSLLACLSQAQTIKFATIAPEGSTWMKVMKDLDREVKRKTKGKVKFKFFDGGKKGDEKSVIKQMRFGTVDSAGFAGLGMGEITGEVRALDVPFLLRTNDEVDHLYEVMFDRFSKAFEEEGYVLLGLSDIGFVHIFSKKSVRAMADLKQTKCWAWSGDLLAETALKRMGVSPIPLALVDVLVSLQTGMIDTIYSPPIGAVAMQWFTKVKYFQEFPLTHSTGGLVITRKAFNRIQPAANQEALKAIARKHMKRLVKLTREENGEAVEALRKAGLQFIPRPDQAEMKRYEEVGVQVQKELAGRVFSKEVLDVALSSLEEFRKGR